MATARPTLLGLAAFTAVCAAVCSAACTNTPETVLQTDLPQIPGMTSRDSADLKQTGGIIESGVFAYKGAVVNLPQRVTETKTRFGEMGWKLETERQTPATARLVFAKEERRAAVEIIRNDVAPGMSTAVTVVTTRQ